ncbi:MAG: zeta toxin family protein [Phycisphaeraceae bacterium]|nr:zeta toxin family protein [Phycisphaeraceae bacterium]
MQEHSRQTSVVPDDPTQLAHLIRARLDASPRDPQRCGPLIILLAGIGASGKTTLAHAVTTELGRRHQVRCAVVGQDGFHRTNRELEALNLRNIKGAPETFDADRLVRWMRQLSDNAHPLVFPVYDRAIHDPVPDGGIIDGREQVLIIEGNFVLLNTEPWSSLAPLASWTWMMDIPIELARGRMIARHIHGGRTPEDALDHYLRVDLPQARNILSCGIAADLSITVRT